MMTFYFDVSIIARFTIYHSFVIAAGTKELYPFKLKNKVIDLRKSLCIKAGLYKT